MREMHWEVVALSQKMFAGAALHDHVVARWAFLNGFYRHFAWNACQAIEKYCKCIILLNSCEKVESTHKVHHLFTEATKHTAGLTSQNFDFSKHSLPDKIADFPYPRGEGTEETLQNFVARMGAVGNPATRYRQSNARVLPLDLAKLDILCGILRKFCIPLGGKTKAGKTYSELLREEPNFDPEVDFAALSKSKYLKSAHQMALFERNNPTIAASDIEKMDFKFSWDSSDIAASAMTTSNREVVREFLETRFTKHDHIVKVFADTLEERDKI